MQVIQRLRCDESTAFGIIILVLMAFRRADWVVEIEMESFSHTFSLLMDVRR